jgi:hypothetical protein
MVYFPLVAIGGVIFGIYLILLGVGLFLIKLDLWDLKSAYKLPLPKPRPKQKSEDETKKKESNTMTLNGKSLEMQTKEEKAGLYFYSKVHSYTY